MDWRIFFTIIATGFSVVGFIHTFLQHFKNDINSHINKLENRIDKFEKKSTSIEERMFWMATGRKLEDVILEEKMKKDKL